MHRRILTSHVALYCMTAWSNHFWPASHFIKMPQFAGDFQ